MADDKRDRADRPEREQPQDGVSRREFMESVGLGAAALGVGSLLPGQARAAGGATPPAGAAGLMPIELVVNGQRHELLVEPRWSLLFVLRERLGLTGAKPGCERGECGACTVLIDDRPRYACLTLAVEAQGQAITTVEGLLDGERLGDVQQAFADCDGFECGYCTPGQVVAVEGLLRKQPAPDIEAIRHGLSGNLCRCGAYPNIVRAAEQAASKRAKGGGQ